MEVARVTVVVVALVSGLTACGSGDTTRDVGSPATTGPAPTWTELPQGPLSPRAGAVGVWTGSEVLVIGGEPEAWCPATADCTPPEFAPLADGAAYDPVSRSWRRIADAPLTFSSNASAVAVGDAVYVLVRDASYRPGGAGGFLRYVPADDRWEELPAPAADTSWYQLASAGGRLVAYPGSAEAGDFPDMVFDPASDTWRRLPADPLAPSFDRTMVGVGDDVYLFAHDLVENPGSERPSLTRTARLDLTTEQWEPRADSEILGSAPWFVEDGVLVNPRLDRADGGEVNNWGRTYPAGGMYDSTTDAWRPLPNPPPGVDVGGSGVIGRTQASFFDDHGVVLDLVTGRWVSIPRLPDDTGRFETNPFNRTIVTAGTDLFVFGGELWTDDAGIVLDTGYVWPSRSADTGTPTPPTTSTPPSTSSSSPPPSTRLPTPSTAPIVVASPPPTSSPPAPPTSAPGDGAAAIDGPLLRSPFDDGDAMDALISGTLTLDRDCLLLGGDDSPVPVVWPAETRWEPDPPSVLLGDGQHLPLGADVIGGGGYPPVLVERRGDVPPVDRGRIAEQVVGIDQMKGPVEPDQGIRPHDGSMCSGVDRDRTFDRFAGSRNVGSV